MGAEAWILAAASAAQDVQFLHETHSPCARPYSLQPGPIPLTQPVEMVGQETEERLIEEFAQREVALIGLMPWQADQCAVGQVDHPWLVIRQMPDGGIERSEGITARNGQTRVHQPPGLLPAHGKRCGAAAVSPLRA